MKKGKNCLKGKIGEGRGWFSNPVGRPKFSKADVKNRKGVEGPGNQWVRKKKSPNLKGTKKKGEARGKGGQEKKRRKTVPVPAQV